MSNQANTRRADCGACVGCALSPGAAANKEPTNYLLATLATLGPFPFYCHEAFDWRDGASSKVAPAKLRQTGQVFRLCQGWVAEVRKLADAGYYKDKPEVTKVYALTAKEHLQEFIFLCSLKRDTEAARAGLAKEKRREAKALQVMLTALLRKRQRYLAQD